MRKLPGMQTRSSPSPLFYGGNFETLCPVLTELHAPAARAPRDTRVAVAHLSATIAGLELPAAEQEAPPRS
jgi:hypothetical protein